jgi:hypothetical protein
MIFIPNPTRLLGFGIQPSGPIRGRCINRTETTINKGEVYMLDLDATDADVSNERLGDKNSIWGNVIATDSGVLDRSEWRICCVFDDEANTTLANDAAGMFTFFSLDVQLLAEDGAASGTATTVITSHFGFDAAGDTVMTVMDATEVAAGDALYAKANLLGVGTDLTTVGGILTNCVFDGINGLATK